MARRVRLAPIAVAVLGLAAATVVAGYTRSRPDPGSPAPATRSVRAANVEVFRGLGTWVDVYDYTLTPEPAARTMRSRGVVTIYLQTSRFTLSRVFRDEAIVERWVHAAHANGMKIVGWYLPGYGDVYRDVHRTAAIASYRTSRGERFDGLAVDIEDKCEVHTASPCAGAPFRRGMTPEDWNAGLVTHARAVRTEVGDAFPMAAITPTPLAIRLRPSHWTGFPWDELPASFDAVMPMAYWSYRHDCAGNPDHCAYEYTAGSVEEVRRLTGSAHVAVHPIGGVGGRTADVADFVRACFDAGAVGGSLYDFRATTDSHWAALSKISEL